MKEREQVSDYIVYSRQIGRISKTRIKKQSQNAEESVTIGSSCS